MLRLMEHGGALFGGGRRNRSRGARNFPGYEHTSGLARSGTRRILLLHNLWLRTRPTHKVLRRSGDLALADSLCYIGP